MYCILATQPEHVMIRCTILASQPLVTQMSRYLKLRAGSLDLFITTEILLLRIEFTQTFLSLNSFVFLLVVLVV